MKRVAPLAALIACACVSASAQVAPLPMALCAGWQSERTCEVLNEDAQVRVLRCSFAPGVGHEMHYHPPHFGVVLSGTSTMRITTATGTVDRPVRPGQTFSNDAEVIHEPVNVGTETTTYIIVEKKYEDRRTPEQVAPGLCAS